MPPARRRFSRPRKVVFTVLALPFMWLLLEIAIAATGLHKRPSERVFSDVYEAAYELLPGVRVPFGNAPTPDDPTNHASFRGPEFTDEKPPGTYRIIAIGDSTTFGVMVPEPQTYARRLETLLRKDRPEVEVLNAGVPGTNIFAHRVLLAKKLRHFAPDLLVVYVLYNSRPEVENIRRTVLRGRAHTKTQLALRHSAVYRLLRRLLKGGFALESGDPLAHYVGPYATDIGTQGGWVETSFGKDLDELAAQAAAAGTKLVLAYHLTRPVMEAISTRRDGKPRPVTSYERMKKLTRDAAQRHDALFVDVTPAFLAAKANNTTLFLDDVHFSSAGHRLMAEALATLVAPIIATPATPNAGGI